MQQANRTCYSCGEKYHYCFSCPDDTRPTWLFMFCCEDCRDIFNTMSDYNYNHISAEDANEVIRAKMKKPLISYSKGIQTLTKQLVNEIWDMQDTQVTSNVQTEQETEREKLPLKKHLKKADKCSHLK